MDKKVIGADYWEESYWFTLVHMKSEMDSHNINQSHRCTPVNRLFACLT